jgi:hypothetical protein
MSTRTKERSPLTVMHPVCLVNEGFEVVDEQFKIDTDAYFQLDQHNVRLAELQVGGFMPGQMLDAKTSNPSASEVNYLASVEQQIRQGVLSRFYGQYQTVIQQMQKRFFNRFNMAEAKRRMDIMGNPALNMVNKMVISSGIADALKFIGVRGLEKFLVTDENYNGGDKDAVETIMRLLRRGLTVEEIVRIANTPPQDCNTESVQERTQALQQVVAKYTGNPRINQDELVRQDVASLVGHDLADKLIIPTGDQTVQAEATRQQVLELTTLATGEQVPVSPKDEDTYHMDVIMQKGAQIVPTLAKAPDANVVSVVENVMKHFGEHLMAAHAKNPKADLSQYDQFMQQSMEQMKIAKTALASGALPPGLGQPPAGVAPAINPQDFPPEQPAPLSTQQGQDMAVSLARGEPMTQTQEVNAAQQEVPQPLPALAAMPLSKGPIPIQPKIAGQGPTL